MGIVRPDRTFHLVKFAKMLGYSRVSDREFSRILKFLENENVVVVQQSGFSGHSLYHPKIVTILRPLELDAFKRIVFSRTNFAIGEFNVHKTERKRKCGQCKHVIDLGQRYGVKILIAKKRSETNKRRIYGQTIVCLPCLLQIAGIEGLEIDFH